MLAGMCVVVMDGGGQQAAGRDMSWRKQSAVWLTFEVLSGKDDAGLELLLLLVDTGQLSRVHSALCEGQHLPASQPSQT